MASEPLGMVMMMMYSLRRRRHWTVDIRRDRIGGHNYYAWVGAGAQRPINPPVQGWARGGRQDALLEAMSDIDKLDGKPDHFASSPKLFKAKEIK